jgi:hypothetical protein
MRKSEAKPEHHEGSRGASDSKPTMKKAMEQPGKYC